MKPKHPPLAHHVFFWLKNPGSMQDRAKLMEGIRTLEQIETVRSLHVGMPASTEKR
ncbi:MAG: Dabb family protein, partial [Bacteroidota bacterium]